MKRMAGLVAGLAVVGAALFAGATPAMAATAAPAAVVHQVSPFDAGDRDARVLFYQNGWYYGYADIWGYDGAGKEIYHDFSGTLGHDTKKWFTVPAGVKSVHWMVRLDPFGSTIKEQWMNWDSWGYPAFCGDNHPENHPTIYVGGTIGHYDTYDMHCSSH